MTAEGQIWYEASGEELAQKAGARWNPVVLEAEEVRTLLARKGGGTLTLVIQVDQRGEIRMGDVVSKHRAR